jgi:hypothetical protein
MIESCWDDWTEASDSLDKLKEKWLRGPATNNTDRFVRGGRVTRMAGSQPTESF